MSQPAECRISACSGDLYRSQRQARNVSDCAATDAGQHAPSFAQAACGTDWAWELERLEPQSGGTESWTQTVCLLCTSLQANRNEMLADIAQLQEKLTPRAWKPLRLGCFCWHQVDPTRRCTCTNLLTFVRQADAESIQTAVELEADVKHKEDAAKSFQKTC